MIILGKKECKSVHHNLGDSSLAAERSCSWWPLHVVLCIFFDLKLHTSNLINIELGFQYSSLFGSIKTHL